MMRETRDLADQVASLETTLFRILQLVNDWLKFAETKNAGLVALVSAAIGLLLSHVSDMEHIAIPAGVILTVGGSCLMLSLLVGIASFFPRTNMLRLLRDRQGPSRRTANLYYFGHLATFSARDLAHTVARRYLDADDGIVEEEHLALAQQVVTNARITNWKLRLFGICAVLFGIGIVMCSIGVVVGRLMA